LGLLTNLTSPSLSIACEFSLADFIANNLFVLIAALLVFTMTGSVGLLEIGELGDEYSHVSLLKVMLITGIGFVVMAIIGFNTAFAPTIGGIIGSPLYAPGLLLGGSSNMTSIFWSMTAQYFGTGLSLGTYFFFETAFATVTLALVGVIVLKKMKLEAFAAFAVVYFIFIWNLPAAWIWNPTGWLYLLGMRDFAGGLVVHGAAGAAGLALLTQIWWEERKSGLKQSIRVVSNVNPGWLTLSIILLWVGWFGFNPGSVLAFNGSAVAVVLTTFLCAAASFLSLMLAVYWKTKRNPGLLNMGNGVLMGLIVITPVAGFVSPGSAIVLGAIAGPLYYAAELWFDKRKWFSDPVGLLPGHLTGGLFGVLMIGFFAENVFAAASGNGSVPNGLLFGGGTAALHQLGIEVFGIIVVFAFVFAVSLISIRAISYVFHGILLPPKKVEINAGSAEI
jgi:ammonium transporter, Amt family